MKSNWILFVKNDFYFLVFNISHIICERVNKTSGSRQLSKESFFQSDHGSQPGWFKSEFSRFLIYKNT